MLKYGIRNVYNKKKVYRFNAGNKVVQLNLADFLNNIPSETIVAFIGLKQIKYYAGIDNPAEYLIDALTDKFKNVIVPAYTASVKRTKYFDVQNSPSESGAFSNAFLKIADYRTPSPFKSFAVKGPIAEEIKKLQFENDYLKGGIFDYLNTKNIPTINIGTDQIRFKSLHYLEYLNDVPYLEKKYIDVVVVDNKVEKRNLRYFNLSYRRNFKINMDKISDELVQRNLISVYNYNGLILRFIPESNYYSFINEKIINDPYYLIN